MKKQIELLTLLAVIIGILCGFLLPQYANYFSFIGSIFLSLLKVLILPIIILSLFLAFTQIANFENLKKIGTITGIYYFCSTAFAVVTSIIIANIFIFKDTASGITESSPTSDMNIVKEIFSENIFESLAKGKILHLVVFVIMFSIAFLTFPKEKKEPIIKTANTIYEVILKLIHWILKIAPIGVFALVWNSISKFEVNTFSTMKSFFIATTTATLIHSFINLPLIAKLIGNFNAFKYFAKVKEAVIISLATASSSAALPVSIKVSQEAGVKNNVAQFVLPLGATLNMDGSALYQSLLIMLFANMSGIELGLAQQLLLFVLIALSSAGTAGVPSGGIVMVSLIMNLFHIPNVEYYIGLYVTVDRFWDYPITSVNVWSDLIGANTINKFFVKN